VKHVAAAMGLLVVLAYGGTALARPDLVVVDIQVMPTPPVVGQEVTIVATVQNVGTAAVSRDFDVHFLMDGLPIGFPSISHGLRVGESKDVSVSWHAEFGTHSVTVEADRPFNEIDEASEFNNALHATFAVRLTMGDVADLEDLRVGVARFEDRSGSGFIDVGEGVADELVERLVNSGVTVVERSEIEAILLERRLNPFLTADVAAAGRMLGVDLLIVGSVNRVDVRQSSFSLGLFSLNSATVEVEMAARLVNVYTTVVERAISAEGVDEGSTGFSVDVGRIIALAQAPASDVCSGGLLTDKPFYTTGETVHIGFRNPGAPGAFTVEIYTVPGGALLASLGSKLINTDGCGEWFWDQKAPMQMPPGTYRAKLWQGIVAIDTVDFQIQPGSVPASPLISEITVGGGAFDETIVGKATNSALNQLVARLIDGMAEIAEDVRASRGTVAYEAAEPLSMEGLIVQILPDGRVAVNVGSHAGVHEGSFFEVLDVMNLITDPSSGQVLAYDLMGVKGELVVIEVFDLASFALKTSEFDVSVGDVIRISPSL